MSASTYRFVVIGTLALLAALLITMAAILLARGNNNAPIQIIAPSSGGAGDVAPGSSDPISPYPTPAPDLRVYINGAVLKPGVYTVQPGDRLADGLVAAGGPTDDANLRAVNLAQRLQDEGYYYIPKAGETPPPVAQAPTGSTSPLSSSAMGSSDPNEGLIDLNTASLEALMSLPGIGQVRAQAIISYREQNGPFNSIEEVTDVTGIGPATYENIRSLVTVGGQ